MQCEHVLLASVLIEHCSKSHGLRSCLRSS